MVRLFSEDQVAASCIYLPKKLKILPAATAAPSHSHKGKACVDTLFPASSPSGSISSPHASSDYLLNSTFMLGTGQRITLGSA